MIHAVKHLTIAAKAPTSAGSFSGEILYGPTEGDKDGERVAEFVNLPTEVPLDFQHLIMYDPSAMVGTIKARDIDGTRMSVEAQLHLGTKMADMIHERLMLPASDPESLSEMSVAYGYDPTLVTTDPNGVKAIHQAELLAISVVHAGAQQTWITGVKARALSWKSEIDGLNAQLDALSAPSLSAQLDALAPKPPMPTQRDLSRLQAMNDQRADHERVRRGIEDPLWTDAYSAEDLQRPVTAEDVEADRIKNSPTFRLPADGFVPYEVIDLEDAEIEEQRLHRDDWMRTEREAEALIADVQRRQAAHEQWNGDGIYSPEDLLRPADRPEPEDESPLRLPISE